MELALSTDAEIFYAVQDISKVLWETRSDVLQVESVRQLQNGNEEIYVVHFPNDKSNFCFNVYCRGYWVKLILEYAVW